MKKLGVKNIIIVVGFGLSIGKEIQAGLADGKFTFPEIIGFADDLAELPSIAIAASKAPAEFADLDEQEKQEIMAMVRKEFDIPDDKVEQAIEESFSLVLTAVQFGFRMKHIFEPKAA